MFTVSAFMHYHFCASVSFFRISLMSFVHQEVAQGCHIWSKELWLGKSRSLNVLVSLLLWHYCESRPCLFICSCVTFSFWIQVKADMVRCGGELGWGRVWPSRSSPHVMSSRGSERLRYTILYSWDMTTYWVNIKVPVARMFFVMRFFCLLKCLWH